MTNDISPSYGPIGTADNLYVQPNTSAPQQFIYTTDNTGSNSVGFPGQSYAINNSGIHHSIAGVTTITTTSGKTINVDELADTLELIKKRFLVLTDNFEKHEKYPMLKQAYEEYKMLEKLISDDTK